MEKVRLAIVGMGTMSQFHIMAVQNTPSVELYALCDRHEDRVKPIAEKNNVKFWYNDYDEMLKNPSIDAVLVVTGNRYHADCAIKALNAGKHVLCEKPIAASAKEAVEMKNAADRNGKILMIAHEFRFSPATSIVKEAVDNGQFGEVYYGKSVGHRRNGHPGGWFANKSIAAGGVMVDCGVHQLDNFMYIKGFPKATSVYAVTYNKIGTRSNVRSASLNYKSVSAGTEAVSDVEDLASALIRFEDGSTFSMEFSYAVNIESDYQEFSLFGTKMGSNYDGKRLKLFSEFNNYMTNISFETPTGGDWIKMLSNQMAHFGACVKGEAECLIPAAQCVEVMYILEAIYKSAELGHEVVIER